MSMTDNDWTSPEYLAGVAADELSKSLEALGINTFGCFLDSDGRVNVAFRDIRDAETMVSLGMSADEVPGSLYDRATASCVSLMNFGASIEPVAEGAVEAAVEAGWDWTIHPYMVGRRMDWHVSVDMSVEDANTVTANLNRVRRAAS